MLIFFLKPLLSVKNQILTAISTVLPLKATPSFVILKSCSFGSDNKAKNNHLLPTKPILWD